MGTSPNIEEKSTPAAKGADYYCRFGFAQAHCLEWPPENYSHDVRDYRCGCWSDCFGGGLAVLEVTGALGPCCTAHGFAGGVRAVLKVPVGGDFRAHFLKGLESHLSYGAHDWTREIEKVSGALMYTAVL